MAGNKKAYFNEHVGELVILQKVYRRGLQ
jgi:hypothetical protein